MFSSLTTITINSFTLKLNYIKVRFVVAVAVKNLVILLLSEHLELSKLHPGIVEEFWVHVGTDKSADVVILLVHYSQHHMGFRKDAQLHCFLKNVHFPFLKGALDQFLMLNFLHPNFFSSHGKIIFRRYF